MYEKTGSDPYCAEKARLFCSSCSFWAHSRFVDPTSLRQWKKLKLRRKKTFTRPRKRLPDEDTAIVVEADLIIDEVAAGL